MEIVCLDMEGTLTPEIWQQVSINTGIKDFAKTTRDIPRYSDLKDERIKNMRDHKISLKDNQFPASQLELLEGAKDFLDRIREKFQVVILSDTFHEIASPLMAKLGFPFLLCHTLKVENGIIVDYELRQDKAKQKAILAFQNLGYRSFAAGDSFNENFILISKRRNTTAIFDQVTYFFIIFSFENTCSFKFSVYENPILII